MSKKPTVFRVRFKEPNKGRNGGFGPTKSFKTVARDQNSAARKLRKHATIVSVRKA